MTQAQIANELMMLANFYGTLVATQDVAEDTKKKCNKQLKRCVDSLDKSVDQLISLSSNIVLV